MRKPFYALPLLVFAGFTSARSEFLPIMHKIDYPNTKRIETQEKHFGQTVSDPYRWLEYDIRSDKDVAAWAEAQNKVTGSYLSGLPGRDVFRQRLAALFDHDQVTAPRKHGNRYFYTRNSGLEDQAVLYVRKGVDGEERALIDPNGWSEDRATALCGVGRRF